MIDSILTGGNSRFIVGLELEIDSLFIYLVQDTHTGKQFLLVRSVDGVALTPL